MLITPNKVKNGDEIRIISTARAISEDEISFAVKKITDWGLTVSLGNALFEVIHQFAGTIEQRINDLQEAINEPSVKAVLFARGGYGTVKLIDKIDFSPLLKNPKWFIGYSDITVLHNHLYNKVGLKSLHASMPINFSKNSAMALESMFNCIQNKENHITFPSNALNRHGNAKGALVGGNLSILYSLIGSKSDIDTEGCILFIEDLDEYLYHIDRMMMNMKRSGKLERLEGLVVGGMTDMNDNDIPFGQSAHQIILDAVAEYDYPVAFDIPAGHLDDNRALFLGTETHLNVKGNMVDLKQVL